MLNFEDAAENIKVGTPIVSWMEVALVAYVFHVARVCYIPNLFQPSLAFPLHPTLVRRIPISNSRLPSAPSALSS